MSRITLKPVKFFEISPTESMNLPHLTHSWPFFQTYKQQAWL